MIVLEGPIAELRQREIELLYDLAEKVGAFGDDGQKDRKRIQQNANDLRDMFFLVVIIGEFNAGKSTFVNAMVGDELLKRGAVPTTDTIQLVRYGNPKREVKDTENELIREWRHPNVEQGIAIVDTPGTGSVFAKHETIAKDFLSRSDLVIFLLSAKRAFAQTEKMYLELARDYGKKIVLVINQKDLLTDKELGEVSAFVKQQVSETLDLTPPLYAVSAKDALENNRGGGIFGAASRDAHGMEQVREHLLETFKRTPPAKQKLFAQLDFADSMTKKYLEKVQAQLDLVVNDERQAKQLRQELEKQAETLSSQLDGSMKELDRVFGQLRDRGRRFITENLSVTGVQSLRGVDRETIRVNFEKDVVGSSLQNINEISENYVNAVVDSSRRYWRSIIDRLNKLEALLKDQVVSPDSGSYSDQRLALQEAIAVADSELKSYTEENLAENLHDIFSTNLSGFNISVASVVFGVVAFVVGASAPGALTATALGVVLGVVAAPVMIAGGGILAYGYWRRLRQAAYDELDERLEKLRKSYRQALEDLTDRERNRLLQYGQQILSPVFSHLDVVVDKYKDQQHDLQTLQTQVKTLREELENIKIITE